MAERKQFTFYRSYFEAVRKLPKREQTAVLLAICAYALDGEEPGLQGTSDVVFGLIRPTLDSSRKKAESGAIGGESKTEANGKQTASKAEANTKQTESKLQARGTCKQTASKKEKEEEEEIEEEEEEEIETEKKKEEEGMATPSKLDEDICQTVENSVENCEVQLSPGNRFFLNQLMGKTEAERYIQRLEEYLKNGGQAKSHYTTILQWWKEDREG